MSKWKKGRKLKCFWCPNCKRKRIICVTRNRINLVGFQKNYECLNCKIEYKNRKELEKALDEY
mgnify:CR=1 FL=1